MSCAMRGQRYGQAELLPDFLQIRYVRLFQVGHVHERHPTGEETEHEDVACEGVLGMQRREVGRAYPFDGFA